MHAFTGVSLCVLVCECVSDTYEAEVREGQTAQAADPGDLVVLQVEDGEAAALLQPCDLAETVVWQRGGGVKSVTTTNTPERCVCVFVWSVIAGKDTS